MFGEQEDVPLDERQSLDRVRWRIWILSVAVERILQPRRRLSDADVNLIKLQLAVLAEAAESTDRR